MKSEYVKTHWRGHSHLFVFLLLFFFWPFLTLILAIANYSHKEARLFVYVFVIYYGLTFVIGNLDGVGSDSERYAIELIRYSQDQSLSFSNILSEYFEEDGSIDIVQPVITYFVSRFTGDYRYLFAVFAAIFGFFYLKSINLLHDQIINRANVNTYVFLAFFIMILPVSAINGFRMWTAAWIFFYAVYHVVLHRDYRFLVLSFSSILVHWSFISANVILLIYVLAGNRKVLYLALSLISFILPTLIEPLLSSVFGFLGGGLRDRADTYYNEGYIQSRQEQFQETVWFMQIGNDLVTYFLFLAILLILYQTRNEEESQEDRNLLSFSLLFLTFVNFGKVVPSFGARFQMLFFLFGTLLVFRFFINHYKSNLDYLTLLGAFPMLLYSAISFRQLSDNLNVWLFSPGFGFPLFVSGIPLAEVLF